MEYDYALSSKIPILSFIHKNPEAIPSGKTDQDDALRKRLEAFRAKVSKSKVVKFWTNPDELQAQVILSMDIGILPPIKREALTMKVEWPAFTVERWPNHSPDQLRLA